LMRSICSLKLSEGGDARPHINNMIELFTKLHDLGEDGLSDKWCAAMLLSSLPKSYDTLITSLESRKQEEVNFGLVQQRILAEYDRNQQSGRNTEHSVMNVSVFVNRQVISRRIVKNTSVGWQSVEIEMPITRSRLRKKLTELKKR